MAIQIGTFDGLVNIVDDKITCFVNAISSFSKEGIQYAVSNNVAFGAAFQRYVEPVYNKSKDNFEILDILSPVYTKGGKEQSPARITYCRKMGLLDIDEPNRIFTLTSIGKCILQNEITIEEYAFILLTKQGVFKDGSYVEHLFSFISEWFTKHASISDSELREAIIERYQGLSIEKTRTDIIINALVKAGLISKIGDTVYVISDINSAEIFNDFLQRKSSLTTALIDNAPDYTYYIGSMKYGIFDILDETNVEVYSKKFPNLKNYIMTDRRIVNERVAKFPLTLPLQQIFYGAPGTGKSHRIKEITKDVPDDDVIRTTFHPDSDYSTFVGAYKPTMQEVPVLTVIGTKQVPVEDKEGKAVTERRIEYDFVPQAFTQAYVRAWRDLDNPVFLVIEEINRGNCAQIFGDIFQLLDRKDDGYSDYWITPDEELTKHLRSEFSKENAVDINAPEDIRQGRKMCLPPNLHIWGTMNTNDQSLFPIDSAFKRRWDWQYIPIDTSKENWSIMVNGSSYSWGQFLDKMNAEIGEVTSSEDKKMGFYFCKTPDGIIKTDKFAGKVLFYVYNDVFKDYGFDRECFKDGNETITFHSFFLPNGDINEPQVEKFLQKLKLSVEGEDEDGNNNSTPSAGRDYTKYSVNGEGQYGKNRVATECVKKYVELHPEKSAEEVLNDWQSLGVNVPHFIESKDVFESRTDSNMRSYPVECKGEIIYVAHNGYGSNGKVKVLMDAVNSKDWGIRIDEA